MITLKLLLQKIDAIAQGFIELFTSIVLEIPEIKQQLENALQGTLETDEARTALAKLENIEQQLPQAIEQVKAMAPTIKTPEPGESPDAPPEPVEVPSTLPEVELPIEVTEGAEGDSVGMEGLPNLDFES